MDDQGDDWGDTLAGFDIGDLNADQRRTLSTDLADAGILHAFIGPELQGPASESELIEHLVAQARRGGRRRAPAQPGSPPGVGRRALRQPWGVVPPEAVGLPISARWRRFIAYLLEAMAFGSVAAVIQVYSVGGGQLFAVGIGWFSSIVLVALFGASLGMMVFRMRIVSLDAPDRVAPGWGVAVVRYLVAWWPEVILIVLDVFMALRALRWLSSVMQIWLVICFLPIILDPARRGLHDRVAGTVVIDLPRRAGG